MSAAEHEHHEEAPHRAAIDCPKCRTMMKRVTIDGVEVDRCQGCGGLWLDLGEKDALMKKRIHVKQADPARPVHHGRQEAKTIMHCPRDKSRLIRMHDAEQRHIEFESCSVCGGVFLDPGELTDLSTLSVGEWLRTFIG